MTIDKNGETWFKGNLHTHTTASDGAKTPREAIQMYKEKGYDCIALTDHWHESETSFTDGMLVLSGVEYDVHRNGCFHIVGYGIKDKPSADRDMTPQQLIDAIHAAGGVATLAHPAWSLNQPSDLNALNGVDCTEIYNSVSGYPYSARPYSGLIIDTAIKHGFRATLTAADDTHFYGGEFARSYVMVKAKELKADAITEAIIRGDCYATQGPIIDFFGIEGEYAVVRVSGGCKYIQFFSGNYWQSDTTTTGGTVYGARFKIKPSDGFIRAEITDFDGNTAFTQPIYTQI